MPRFKKTMLWLPRFFTKLKKPATSFMSRVWARPRLSLAISLLIMFLFLHFRVLPSAFGYYNAKCYMTEDEMTNMRHLLVGIVKSYNQLNITYWLDYGTLLGVIRNGDIMAYDADIDIGRYIPSLSEDHYQSNVFATKLNKLNITGNAMIAKYKGRSADLFRWMIKNQTVSGNHVTEVLYQYYPFIPRIGFLEAVNYYFIPAEIPIDVILPTREITVYGVRMQIPNKPLQLIKRRYPLTWFISFPYKWKCWL